MHWLTCGTISSNPLQKQTDIMLHLLGDIVPCSFVPEGRVPWRGGGAVPGKPGPAAQVGQDPPTVRGPEGGNHCVSLSMTLRGVGVIANTINRSGFKACLIHFWQLKKMWSQTSQPLKRVWPPYKNDNIMVSSDGVNHRLWQSWAMFEPTGVMWECAATDE